jgi:L-amino acid N-acyltransferase
MLLRSATSKDLPAINAIYNYYVRRSTCTFQIEPWSLAERAEWFEAHGERHPVIVAVIEPAVVGWASLSRYRAREGYEHTVELSVYVDRSCRGQGLGRALVAELVERAIAAGHHVVVSQVAADQGASRALHEALGFREAGLLRQVGRKLGRWLDVVLFEKVLPSCASAGYGRSA